MLGFRRISPRLRFLLLTIVIIGAAGASIIAYRKYQVHQTVLTYRPEGMKAYEAWDYKRALNLLGQYLRRHDEDTEILYAYARARLEVPEPRDRHVSSAISALRHLLER